MNFKKVERIHVIVLIGAAFLVSLVLFLHFRNDEMEEMDAAFVDSMFIEEEEETEEIDENEENIIVIDIKGAIRNPGVYEFTEGSRLFEVIERAGGLLENADEKQLNLAQLLSDEMMIYVPAEGEEGSLPMNHQEQEGKIAINSADAATLEQLPGIGPAKAEVILTYREEHGPFNEIEDLLQVTGIGPKSLEQLRDHISLQ